MDNVLRNSIQQVSAVAVIFMAISYSFTLGYFEYLKIPETPEYLEASNFFIRTIFYAGRYTALFEVMLPIAVFLIFIFIFEKLNEKWSKKLVSMFRCLKDCEFLFRPLILILFTTILAFRMYYLGESSLKNKEGPVFPMALLSEKKFTEISHCLVWKKGYILFKMWI